MDMAFHEGTSGDDIINWRITGFNRSDTILGLDGNDTIDGGGGGDLIRGGAGNDRIDHFGWSSGVHNGIGDTLQGGSGDDTIEGGEAGDLIEGGDGNDHLKGNKGDDSLFGGTGDDYLQGGDGDDTLDWGDDYRDDEGMNGGRGNDVFIVSGGGGRISGGPREGDGERDVVVFDRASHEVGHGNLITIVGDHSTRLSGGFVDYNYLYIDHAVELYQFQDGVVWTHEQLIEAANSLTDDHGTDAGSAGQLNIGASVTGAVETAYDMDWFAVTLQEGVKYQIDLEGRETGGGLIDNPTLRGIYDTAGALLPGSADSDSGEGLNARLGYEATYSGVHYISAGAHWQDTGTYSLSVQQVADDFTQDKQTTGHLTVGGSVTGELEVVRDRDWFAVTLREGVNYRFDLEGEATGKGTLEDPLIYGVSNAVGDTLPYSADNNSGEGNNSSTWFMAAYSGVHYVSVGGYSVSTGTYTLSAVEMVDDYLDNAETTGTLVADAPTVGDVERPGDRDWFAVHLEAGAEYVFTLEGAEEGRGTHEDPRFFGVYDSSGAVHDYTNNAIVQGDSRNQVVITAEETGIHHVSIGGYGDTTGTYSLSVRQFEDDYSGDETSIGRLQVDGTITGLTQFDGDHDWIGVELQKGRIYQIEVQGGALGDGTFAQSYVYAVRNESLDLLPGSSSLWSGEEDDGRAVASINPTQDGLYFIDVGSSSHTEPYTLTIREGEDDFYANIETTGRIEVGGEATGEINVAHDTDWFAADLRAGVTYAFRVEGESTGKGTLELPYVAGIRNSEGEFIQGTVANAHSRTGIANSGVTPENDGTHYFSVGGLYRKPGTYSISLTEIEDDYHAGPSTTGRLSVGGDPVVARLDGDNDRDWFGVDLIAGVSYRVEVIPYSSEDSEDQWVNARLHGLRDSDGNTPFELSTFSLTGNSSYWGFGSEFSVTETGTYFVVTSGYRFAEGTYSLSISTLPDLTGTDGNDWFNWDNDNVAGIRRIQGGDGIDTVSFAALDAGVFVNLSTGSALSPRATSGLDLVLDSIENVTGSRHADVMAGGEASEWLRGLGGNDTLYAQGTTADRYDGGGGWDTLSYVFNDAGVSVSLLRGTGFSGAARGDQIREIENLVGTFHDDILWGDHGMNQLEGGAGDDILIGNGGDDKIFGGFGSDTVIYSGNRSDYRIEQDRGATIVTDLTGISGVDHIRNVEVLRFADGDMLI